MRLGILACLLTLGLTVAAAPAQAWQRSEAERVVSRVVRGLTDIIDDTSPGALRDSFRRDRAGMRDLLADLRGPSTRAENRAAKQRARTTAGCVSGKVRFGLRDRARVAEMLAESAEAAQAILDAYDPGDPDGEEVERFLDEAAEQREAASAHSDQIVSALVPVRCARPEPSVEAAEAATAAAYDAAFADRELVLEAYELSGGPGDVVEARR